MERVLTLDSWVEKERHIISKCRTSRCGRNAAKVYCNNCLKVSTYQAEVKDILNVAPTQKCDD